MAQRVKTKTRWSFCGTAVIKDEYTKRWGRCLWVIFGQVGMSEGAWTVGPNGVGLMAQVCLNKWHKPHPWLQNTAVACCTVGNKRPLVNCYLYKEKKRHVLHHSVPSQHQPSGLSCPCGSPLFIYLHVVNKTPAVIWLDHLITDKCNRLTKR